MVQLQVSLGDLLVAASVIGSFWTAYQASKGHVAAVVTRVDGLDASISKHAKVLKHHSRLHDVHTRKVAAVEGAIFGRRADDVIPELPDVPHVEDL